MITALDHVTVVVRDQDEALKFYTEKLGLEKRADSGYGNGYRWLTAAPKGQQNPEEEITKLDKQLFTTLFDCHYWANRQVWSCVIALTDEQFTRDLGNFIGSIRAQLVHMMAEENLWVNYLWHDEVEFLKEAQFPTRAAIRTEWDALEAEMRDFIDGLTPAELTQEVTPGFLAPSTGLKVWEILWHIIKHATERRAQVIAGLRHLGLSTAPHDFLD